MASTLYDAEWFMLGRTGVLSAGVKFGELDGRLWNAVRHKRPHKGRGTGGQTRHLLSTLLQLPTHTG